MASFGTNGVLVKWMKIDVQSNWVEASSMLTNARTQMMFSKVKIALAFENGITWKWMIA
jgi:hypothetical protein